MTCEDVKAVCEYLDGLLRLELLLMKNISELCHCRRLAVETKML